MAKNNKLYIHTSAGWPWKLCNSWSSPCEYHLSWTIRPLEHAISIVIAEASPTLQAHCKPSWTLSLPINIVQKNHICRLKVHSTYIKRNCKRTGDKAWKLRRVRVGDSTANYHNYNEHFCMYMWNVAPLRLSPESKVGQYTLLIYIHVHNLHTPYALVIEIFYTLKLLSKELIQVISRLLIFIFLFVICWLVLHLRDHLSSGSPG